MALKLLCVAVCLANALATFATTVDRIEYNLQEELLAYSFVGDVASDSRIRQLYNQTVLDQLQFTVLPRSDDRNSAADLFTVTRNDGIVRVRRKVDRDRLCPRQDVCAVSLDVAIHGPLDVFRIVKVRIRIVDINDNTPTFAEEHVTRQIPENTETGTTFSVPAAEDPDSPANGVTRYKIRDATGTFALKVTNASGSSLDVHLVLMTSVDREMQRSHRVVVTATDGGTPTRTGSMTIDVVILDVNDNHPTFEGARYEVDIPEDRPAGSILTSVRATDLDSGRFGEIVYGLSDKTVHLYAELFSINATNGSITMTRQLDFEAATEYDLVATAREKYGHSIPAETVVRVRVRDVNDNAPAITVNVLASHGRVVVLESAAVGSFLAYVSVVDADMGDNGEVECRLVDAGAFDLRTLFPGEFKLETTAQLDRESVDEYDVMLTCHDLGTPVLTSTAIIKVTLIDENDNAPIFTKQTYSAFVLENNMAGASVAQVTATDADTGANGVVSYHIHGTAQRYLTINSSTGLISAKISFDHEQLSSVRAVIVASDNSSVRPRSSSVVLVLTVLDVNDETPTFLMSLFEFVAPENLATGSKVGQVSAIDADSDPYSKFTFSFAASVAAFTIDASSGEVFTRQSLDRENQTRYDFVVMATDQHTAAMSDSARVRVTVYDVNDNAPLVEFPTPLNCTVNASPRSRIGHEVARVVASDIDTGNNARLTFGMTRYNRFFDIDTDTGAVFVKRHLAEITDQTVTLYILVNDAGKPPRSVEVKLKVVVSIPAGMDGTHSSSLLDVRGMVIAVPVGIVTVLLTILLAVVIVTIKRRASRRKKIDSLRRFFSSQTIVLREDGTGEGKPEERENGTGDTRGVYSDKMTRSPAYPVVKGDQQDAMGHCFDVDVADELSASELAFLQQVSLTCNKQVSLTCNKQVSLTCNKQVSLTCNKQVSLTCNKQVSLTCNKQVSLTCNKQVSLTCNKQVSLTCN